MSIPRKPGIFIPTLYFAEGLPYAIVMQMSGVFFKSLGADNVFIGISSLLSLPWSLKFLWSPLVDLYFTKRRWIVAAQFILTILIGGLAAVAGATSASALGTLQYAAVPIMLVIAIASATHDVSIDGYYLDVLAEDQKAFFVGIRNTAYRVAWIFSYGGMVYLAGKLAETHGLPVGWAVAFALCSAAMLACGLFHKWYLPEPGKTILSEQNTRQAAGKGDAGKFVEAILTYFNQPKIVAIVFYILVFRLGDALMLKQAPNFLLDPAAKAGLGISVADMGMVSGTVGIISLLLGGILASYLISRDGLKRWMWPLTLTQNGAILLYWVLSNWSASLAVHSPSFDNPYLPAVYVINSAEQFAYGMGVSAYTTFLLTTVRSEYKAAHYATASAMMAIGVLVPQTVSGFLYNALGYTNFFLFSFFASLPGVVAINFLPLWREHTGSKSD